MNQSSISKTFKRSVDGVSDKDIGLGLENLIVRTGEMMGTLTENKRGEYVRRNETVVVH